jgi:hypothetical protein
VFTIIDPVDGSEHKRSSRTVLLSGTLSVTYNDMLASCDGVNVFGRRCSDVCVD